MSEELLDIYDANGNPTGAQKTRREVHEQGLWHHATDVWFLNSKGELLIQLRSPFKDNNPNKWDISSGGHVGAGESDEAGVRREIKEEFGLEVKSEDLQYLGTVTFENSQPGYINKEFNPIFLVRLDFDVNNIKKQEAEVAAIKWIDWRELKKIVASHDPSFVAHEEEYKLLFEYLAAHPFVIPTDP